MDYVEAILHYKSVKPKSVKLNRKIAESYFILGDFNSSEKFYDDIPEDARTATDLFNLAKIYLARDQFEAAILVYEKAKENGGDLSEIEVNLNAIDELIAFRNSTKGISLSKIKSQPKGKCLGISSFSDGIVYSNTSGEC